MTTFYDPAKIRDLAATGDPFWKGAAWVLDQQDAAYVAAREELKAALDRSMRSTDE